MTDSDAPFLFRDGAIHATVDVRLYRVTAIQKTAYRMAERCTVILGSSTGDQLPIILLFSRAVDEEQAREVARMFFQELLDQELREKISDETRAIRSLLLAHAFSKTDLIQRD